MKKYDNLYINQKNYVLYYKKYNFFEYKQLGFVLDDINNLDFQQFNEKISLLKSNKYKINQKNAEIAKNSINTLCRSFLGLKKIKYSLMLKNIFAKIIYENKNSKNNELIIFYSDFFTDPKILTDLLKNIEKPN